MTARRLIIQADGGSRGNPGPAGYGAVVLDAVTGEVLAGAVSCVDLDSEVEQVSGEPGDPVSVGNRQQGSQPGSPPIRAHGDTVTRRCGRV